VYFFLVDKNTISTSDTIEFATHISNDFKSDFKSDFKDLLVDIVDMLVVKIRVLDEPITVILDTSNQIKFKITSNGNEFTSRPFDIMIASSDEMFDSINELVVQHISNTVSDFVNHG
jgi:hypothetical protein